MICGYEIHPACEKLPPLDAQKLKRLEEGIKQNGQHTPALIYQGKILDGRHRAMICEKLGIALKVEHVSDDANPWKRAWHEDSDRREMDQGQRAALFKLVYDPGIKEWEAEHQAKANLARSEKAKEKERTESGTFKPVPAIDSSDWSRTHTAPTRNRAAEMAGVSPSTMGQVEQLAKIEPAALQRVVAKEVTLTQALRTAKENKREERRQQNAIKASAATSPIEAGSVFSTILLDPPWDWGDEGDINQMGRARPDYATMTQDELARLPLNKLADKDCHIYMWITNRSLPKGFALLDAWGFRYVTLLTWPKKSFGLGNYFRGQTEHILFGVKGSLALRRKDAGTLLPQWERGNGGHSSKPHGIYDFIESCSPGPYLEMFARGNNRDKWSAWGADQ